MMRGVTPAAFPDSHAESDPGKAAVIMGGSGRVVTYAELADRSRRGARVLRAAGARRGDAVAILVENRPAFLDAAWAAQRAGLRYTAISTRFTPDEVGYILGDCGAKVLVTSAACAGVARRALAHAVGVEGVYAAGGPVQELPGWEAALAAEPGEPLADEAEGADMLYSSGTTGRPKGVEVALSLAPIGTPPGIAALLRDRWDFGRDTVYLSPAPLYHAAPLRFSMTVHRFGGTVVVMERFDPAEALRLIERHRVTHVQMVPTMFVRLLKLGRGERAGHDLSSLRAVIHAAAPCPPDVKEEMIGWLGPIVHEYYSSTENSLFTAITPEKALERRGSVGRAVLGVPHILDDHGAELPPGEPGTIWSEGGMDFAYHRDPEKTAKARNDRGWTTVGDIGYLDEDGYLYLTDRTADVIISGGVNVYPQEAENVLVGHPRVADVAVFGIPHAEMGEEVKAVVQPVDMADAGAALEAELIAYCRERLARYKCPRTVDFDAELPRHPTGKLYKRLLRDRYAAAAR
jgi:long-chain acyl-CoA synthetase